MYRYVYMYLFSVNQNCVYNLKFPPGGGWEGGGFCTDLHNTHQMRRGGGREGANFKKSEPP